MQDQTSSTHAPHATDSAARWHDGPSSKQRTAVQRMVRTLLDQLAPERPPARAGLPQPPVQLLRSPRGCILQTNTRAVSVSWFPVSDSAATLGELHVIVWDGVVARPGSANRATSGAVSLGETLLRPEAGPDDAWLWRGVDGEGWSTEALVARCHALLADDADGGAPPTRSV